MTTAIRITTGARLHFGPLAVRAAHGRSFGGVGLMVDSPSCVVELQAAERDQIAPPAESPRVERLLDEFRRRSQQPVPPCRITVHRTIPAHAGLGSGTQLSMAVGRGLAALAGEVDPPGAEIARRVGRGRRSAIGVHGFERGGFLVDAGKPSPEALGELAFRAPLPEAWRFLLVRPPAAEGLSGAAEQRAFDALGPMPPQLTDQLCRIVMMQWLPAVQQHDFGAFCAALDAFGRLVGEFFRPAQGGHLADRRMERLADLLHTRGVQGVAQSSWGPTLVVCRESEAAVARLQDELAALAAAKDCTLHVVRPLNSGATIDMDSAGK